MSDKLNEGSTSIPDYKVEIRFADIDAMGHVNNAVYFTYCEQARIYFFAHALNRSWDWRKLGILVAHNEIDYYKPILLQDQINVEVSCLAIGTKSFTLGYKFFRGEELCSKGASVLVCYSHELKQTQQIPPEWMAMLNNYIEI